MAPGSNPAPLDWTADRGTRLLGRPSTPGPRITPSALAAELAARLGRDQAVVCASGSDALALAAALARARSGHELLGVALAPGQEPPPGPTLAAGTPAAEAHRRTDIAAWIIAPVPDVALPNAALRDLVHHARTAGIPVVLDERETAGRTAAGSAADRLGLAGDLLVVGESLAAGCPFGAVLGAAEWRPRGDGEATPPDAEALRLVLPTLDRIRAERTPARAEALGEQLRQTFHESCQEQDIAAQLLGPAARMDFAFAGQERATGAQIHEAFVQELAQLGVRAERGLWVDPDWSDAEVETTCDALRRGAARLRVLLVEHNSYLTGGRPWVFTTGGGRLRERGLAVYRFPRDGGVDVTMEPGLVRIAVAPGDLGEVTSSGFYVPTRVRGDVEVEARYRLPQWRPGAAAASFALFAQDEPSTLRYYAQRRSAGSGAAEVIGNFHNRSFTDSVAVTANHGAFRLRRKAGSFSVWHRDGDAPWVALGSHEGDAAADLIIGAKIWSSGITGGLEAELSELQIEGEVPADQIPPVPVRPDPRTEAGS
ncbi:MAG: hypothetical protein AAF628_24170 [Planctomycetota bacterium]